jgi:hypothetical protein
VRQLVVTVSERGREFYERVDCFQVRQLVVAVSERRREFQSVMRGLVAFR